VGAIQPLGLFRLAHASHVPYDIQCT